MRTLLRLAVVSLATVVLPQLLPAQQPGSIDAVGLKGLIEGLGYTPKPLNAEAGKEKYEFTLKSGGLDVPVAAEISPSRNLLWLTVFLGKAPTDPAAPVFNAMLKQNFKIQPTQFYITESGNLMLGIAIENRTLSPAVFRRWLEKIASDVVATKEFWQN